MDSTSQRGKVFCPSNLNPPLRWPTLSVRVYSYLTLLVVRILLDDFPFFLFPSVRVYATTAFLLPRQANVL